jgi:hypothetical protein
VCLRQPNSVVVLWSQEGDTLRFRVWKKSADAEYVAQVIYQEGHSCVYTANGLSILDELVADLGTDVAETGRPAVPGDCKLHQNYPNPFNPTTTIHYDLPKASRVVLKVYNVLGEEIRTLVDENQTAGYKSAIWNGKNNFGQPVSSGIYIYRLQADHEIQSRRTLFLK